MLSAQSALLGHVSEKLRAVHVDTHQNIIEVNFYFDGEISDEEHEFYANTIDEIIADFSRDSTGKLIEFFDVIDRLDYPKKIPNKGLCVYRRYET